MSSVSLLTGSADFIEQIGRFQGTQMIAQIGVTPTVKGPRFID